MICVPQRGQNLESEVITKLHTGQVFFCSSVASFVFSSSAAGSVGASVQGSLYVCAGVPEKSAVSRSTIPCGLGAGEGSLEVSKDTKSL